MIKTLLLSPAHQGLHEFTSELAAVISANDLQEGICTLFVKHTSCSLLIQENADPSARQDLENWFNRLVSENDPMFTHILEGPDDMPSHIKSALTATTLSIPFQNGKLCLGTWQGVFLWEHRHRPGTRTVVVHIGC